MDSIVLEEELARIEENPVHIQSIKEPSYELIEEALYATAEIFKYLKPEQLTERICTLAIIVDSSNLKYVPDEFRTEKLCILAITRSTKNLRLLHDKQITTSLLSKLVISKPKIIKKLPSQYVTPELEQLALEHMNRTVGKK